MNPRRNKLMKIIAVFSSLLLISFISFFLLAMKTKQMVSDIWTQLGITQVDAHQNINTSFCSSYLAYYGAKNAKNIAAGDRVAVLNSLIDYSKKYVASAEFKKSYQEIRNRNKPQKPGSNINVDSIRKSQKEHLKQKIREDEEMAKATNEKFRKTINDQIEKEKKDLASLDDPNSPYLKEIVDMETQINGGDMQVYNNKLKKFDVDFPEDLKVLLKKNLQRILDVTADVDYNAELKEAYKKKVFVNPVYERKPNEWKLAFRAGKPTTDALRAAAEKWLKELN